MYFAKLPAGWQFFFRVPDYVPVALSMPPARPPQASNVSCTLHKLISVPNIYVVPLEGCGGGQYVSNSFGSLNGI